MARAATRTCCFFTATAALALAIGLVACPAGAAASAEGGGGFSAAELASLKALFGRHDVVALVDSDQRGEPRAMTLAMRVAASRENTFKVFEDPENFYYISTLFKENKVLQEHGNTKAFSWASRHKLFSVVGRNTIALFPPRRADVTVVDSSMGSGVFKVILHEDGPDHTIVVVSGLLDVQTSEWLIRVLLGGNPAIRQAMNVAIGLVMIKGIADVALRYQKGQPLDKHRTRGKAGGAPAPLSQKELLALAPLLVRGQVVICDSHKGGRLRQITAVEVVEAPAADVFAAVGTPAGYSRLIKAIDKVEIHSNDGAVIDFSWNIGLSVFGLTSRNRMSKTENGVLVEASGGELDGAKWRWQIVPTAPNRTVVAYHGFANLRRSTSILEQTLRREPYLEHGLVAGSNMVMLGAIRRGVEQR
ncbi:MAG TPA: SRPBCC family protein [Polyangia bacterium]|nr:SRPBCC family protein [Polyangia bacterium]